MILGSFRKEMNKTFSYYSVAEALNTTIGNYTKTDTLVGTGKGFLFQGSAVDRLISERLRVNVTAVLVVDPNRISFTIADTGKIVIGTTSYSVERADNVGEQGEVLSVALKEHT